MTERPFAHFSEHELVTLDRALSTFCAFVQTPEIEQRTERKAQLKADIERAGALSRQVKDELRARTDERAATWSAQQDAT
jgi:hypothetical protein